ncbi:MAG: hypothetical protein QOH97_1606 [Actinoplanes sp.]|jgi:hypothetical protein|nr:hypothetical protein [Actinoplanes sp.]
MPRNTGYRQFSYLEPVDQSMPPAEIAMSLFAFPFIMVFGGLYEAWILVRAWGGGVRAGLGFGKDAAPVIISAPTGSTSRPAEPAYLQYLFGPVWIDVRHTVKVAAGKGWERVTSRAVRTHKKHFLPPEPDSRDKHGNAIIGFARWAALGLGLLLAGALVLAVLIAQAVAIALLWLFGLGVIQVLRAVDSVLLSLRRIRITCPSCGRHVPYPSYKCDGCGKVQRDVRPGRYGVFHRHCRCSKPMPTLLMLGSHRLDGLCPHCGKELEAHAGAAPETVLPVFGPAGAGKTQLLLASAIATRALLERAGGVTAPADRPAEQWLRQTVEPFARGGVVSKTATAAQHAHSLRLELRGRRRVLKMFDAAGEWFQNPARIAEMAYLEANPTFVFVVDPLTVPNIWNGLESGRREKLASIRAAASPYKVYETTVQTMHRDLKARMRTSRLAVVVSKADLIRPEVAAAGVSSGDSIENWLAGPLDQGNLTRSMGLEFASVGYFLTSSLVAGGEADPSIDTFVSWVLAGEGMTL